MTMDIQKTNEIDDFSKSLMEIEQTQKMCAQLMKTPHYAKLGEVGIFTIVQKARSIGLNPLDALNGAMYFVNGKVELSANTMNYIIRSKGHSITKDKASNNECCILHGKRSDNGDTWTASFSIKEAKIAGIYKNVWEKYPDDMLFARALTRLARQLFADVVKGCYVEGEISSAIEAENNTYESKPIILEVITDQQADELNALFDKCSPEFQDKFNKRLKEEKNINSISMIPSSCFEATLKALIRKSIEYQDSLSRENINATE